MAVLPNRRYPQWSPPATALVGPLPDEPRARRQATAARLLELARVALAVIDADAARDCLLPASRIEISGDDFEYDIALCNTLRRGLLRVERLTDLAVHCAVWWRRPDKPDMADLMLAGTEYTGQFCGWQKFPILMPDAMRQAFDGEPSQAASGDGRWLSVFVPLHDSLDDIVAVLELCVRDGAQRPSGV